MAQLQEMAAQMKAVKEGNRGIEGNRSEQVLETLGENTYTQQLEETYFITQKGYGQSASSG